MTAQTAQVMIKYVNPRQGNRPPSVKDGNGTIYTITDAAIATGMFQPNAQGNIGFYINQRGYHVATHWNGVEVPKDNGHQQPPAAPHPQQSPAPAYPATRHQPTNDDDKSASMFVMGVIGRSFQGTGNLPDEGTMTDMVARLARAYKTGMALSAQPSNQPPQEGSEPPTPQGPDDYGMPGYQ